MRPRACDLIVGRWGARFLGRTMPCSIGSGGMTETKTEGDGGTPIGQFRFMGSGYRPDRIKRPWPGRGVMHIRPIGPRDIWSDDPKDPSYNQPKIGRDDPFSHETLRRADRMYDLFIITDFNWPNAVAGQGSAIFVHFWKQPRRPTAGCIAFARKDLLWIVKRWRPESQMIVQS